MERLDEASTTTPEPAADKHEDCVCKRGFQMPEVGLMTAAIHSGQDPDRWKSRAVVPPVVTATTFKQSSPYGDHPEFVYARSGNPTRAALERCLAAVESAKFAFTFASGMGAASALISLLSAGDHVLTSGDIYGGTTRLFTNVVARMGIEITYVDFTNIDSVKGGLKNNTKV